MKKVLIVHRTFNGGGAEKVLINILKNLDSEKIEVDILLVREEGIYLEEARRYVNSLKSLIRNNSLEKKITNRIKNKLKRILFSYGKFPRISKEYDTIISFLEGEPTLFLSNLKTDAKKVAWVHTDLKKIRLMNLNKEKKAYEKIDKVVFVSEGSKNSFQDLFDMDEEKLDVVYNPIDKKGIEKLSSEEIDFFIDKEYFNIISIGRVCYEKGFDIFLESIKRLVEKGYKVKLILVGEVLREAEFKKLIIKNNLSKNIELLGFKKNPYKYLSNADILVSASRFEGFSLVIAEAMTLGKPVIATKCKGVIELLDNGKYGKLIDCESINELEESLEFFLKNEKLLETYSELSKERSKIFNLEKTINKIIDLF